MTAMFVNLPVTDLERAKAFYTAIGFTINPAFTDLPIGDPATNPSVSTAIFLDSRDEVDKAVTAGIAAGGTEGQPASDYGFMYQRQLSDPDGNMLEFGWMDPVAASQGPAAFMEQQA